MYRKPTELPGIYTKGDSPLSGGRMVVKNISMGGCGFLARVRHNLKSGDHIEVKFRLDDPRGSEIHRRAVVRVVDEVYVGCEFLVQPGTYDAALGFYLRK